MNPLSLDLGGCQDKDLSSTDSIKLINEIFGDISRDEQLSIIIDLCNSYKYKRDLSSSFFENSIISLLSRYQGKLEGKGIYKVVIDNNLKIIFDWLFDYKSVPIVGSLDENKIARIATINDYFIDKIFVEGHSYFKSMHFLVAFVKNIMEVTLTPDRLMKINKILKMTKTMNFKQLCVILPLESHGVNIDDFKQLLMEQYPLFRLLDLQSRKFTSYNYLDLFFDDMYVNKMDVFFKQNNFHDASKNAFGIHSKRFITAIMDHISLKGQVNYEYLFLLYKLSLIYKDNYNDFLKQIENRKIFGFIFFGDKENVPRIANLFWLLSFMSNTKRNVFVNSYFNSLDSFTARSNCLGLLNDLYGMAIAHPDHFKTLVQKISAHGCSVSNLHDLCSDYLLKYNHANFQLHLIDDPVYSKIDGHLLNNGFKIIIPKDQHELINWTIWLKNCVGVANYGKKVLNKECVLLGFQKGKKINYIMEIRNRDVVQFSGFSNESPDLVVKDEILTELHSLDLIDLPIKN